MLPVGTLSIGKFAGAAKLFTVACVELRTARLGTPFADSYQGATRLQMQSIGVAVALHPAKKRSGLVA